MLLKINHIFFIFFAGFLNVARAQTGTCYTDASCTTNVCTAYGDPPGCVMTSSECDDYGGLGWNGGSGCVTPSGGTGTDLGFCFCVDGCTPGTGPDWTVRFEHGVVLTDADCTSIDTTDAPCFDGATSCEYTANSWKTLAGTCQDFGKVVEAEACGDPHFKTFGGKSYDYHGECDLVLIHNPDFADGLGLDIHGRTTRDHSYSFISEVAVRIGDNVLEVHSMGEHKVNSVSGELTNTTSINFGDFEFSHWHSGKVYFHRYYFHLGDSGEMLEIKAFENIIYFQVSSGIKRVMKGSVGMLGDERTGEMVGRDRVTIIEDPEVFAAEWQVRDTDVKLFSTDRYPQWPDKCLPANKFAPRLGEQLAKERAAIACSQLTGNDKENCIFDVVATGNVNLANFQDIEAEAMKAEKKRNVANNDVMTN